MDVYISVSKDCAILILLNSQNCKVDIFLSKVWPGSPKKGNAW